MKDFIKEPSYYSEALSVKINEISEKLSSKTYTDQEGIDYAKEIKILAKLFEQSFFVHRRTKK